MPSLVEIGSVILEKKMKMWKVYDNDDNNNDDNDNNDDDGKRTNFDQCFEKLTVDKFHTRFSIK